MGRTSFSSSGGKGGGHKSRPHSGRLNRSVKFGSSSGRGHSHGSTPRGGGRGRGVGTAGGLQSRRVFVGNLAYETSWQNLKDHFKPIGPVVYADVMTGHDGRSKGCGIIEYNSVQEAQWAIRQLNETELDGRVIFLREDREDKEVVASGGGGGGGKTVFVGNLSWQAKWQDLKDHMKDVGNVAHVDILESRDGRSKGCGLVTYESARDAARALRELDGTTLMGRELFVQSDDRDGSGFSGDNGRPDPPGAHHEERNCSVFIGNLSYETSWQDLKDFMRQAGNVSRADILTGTDGRSKGCGTVEYEDPRDAARALKELNETELDGRIIYVQEDRGSGGGGHHGHSSGDSRGGGGGGGGSCQLYIGNLSYDTKWTTLKDHFKQCGNVDFAEVMEGNDGRSKGFGTIRYFNARDADEAIRRLDGTELQGRRIHVRLDHKA